MDDKEIAALVAALAPVIKGHVESVAAPLFARIATLEARPPVPGPAGKDGPSADEVREIAAQAAYDAVTEKMTGFPPILAGPPGPAGADGKDADVEAITAAVMGKIMEVVKAIPAPKDGADGRDGKDGANGVGLAGAVIDRAGELVVTLTDGTQKSLGQVIGKDGEPGKDGADGLGFDDLSVEMADDGRTIIHRWERGERVKEARLQLAVVLYRGVYKEDAEYQAGDCTTWAGSSWIAQRESKGEKPGESNDAWKLAVKRGRDGRDGVMKPLPDKGPVKL